MSIVVQQGEFILLEEDIYGEGYVSSQLRYLGLIATDLHSDTVRNFRFSAMVSATLQAAREYRSGVRTVVSWDLADNQSAASLALQRARPGS